MELKLKLPNNGTEIRQEDTHSIFQTGPSIFYKSKKQTLLTAKHEGMNSYPLLVIVCPCFRGVIGGSVQAYLEKIHELMVLL